MKSGMPLKATSLIERLKELHRSGNNIAKFIDDPRIPDHNLEQDYIELRMHIVDKDLEGAPVQLQNLYQFSEIDSEVHSPKRVFIGGDLGVGKSTALNKLKNSWGHGKVLHEINYLFPLKLTSLSNNDWTIGYDAYIFDHPLACFIHYSLRQVVNKKSLVPRINVMVEEIIDIMGKTDKSDVLLLVDGGEEMPHFKKSFEIIQNIVDSILEFDNVIMAARSKTLPTSIENGFKVKVKILGLDGDGVESYVKKWFTRQYQILKEKVNGFFDDDKHADQGIEELLNNLETSVNPSDCESFLELKKILKAQEEPIENSHKKIIKLIKKHYSDAANAMLDILQTNQAIRDLFASTPMNAAMLCLIYSESKGKQIFTEELTLEGLYGEIMNWTGKRFTSRASAEGNTVDAEDTLKILAQLAYKTLEVKVISEQEINKISKKSVSVDTLYDFGLLKRVQLDHSGREREFSLHQGSEGKRLFSFRDQGTLEYLAAREVSDLLILKRGSLEARQAAEFIASHRHETKYQMFLEFVAGIVSNLEDKDQIAITRFWEAVTCNVDEVLELGIDRKVILWMHLLPQTSKEGIFDSRIPGLDKIIQRIDKVVLSDFIRWKEFIKTSGYLSDAIKDFLESNIDKGFRNAALSRKEESVEDSSSSEELGDRANNLEIDEIMVLGEELAIDSRYRSSTRTERFQSMSDPDAIAKAAIETIGSLLGKLDNTALFQTLYSNLGDNENYKVKRAAINVMIMILRNQQLTEDNQYIRLFKEKLAEYLLDSQLEDLARLGLRIADVSPKSSGESKEGELSTSGEIHIIHNSPPSPSKPSSRIAQKEIDKFLRLSMKDAVIQLKSTKGNAYQIAIKVLTDYLSTNPVWNKEDKWIERFDSLLDLLGYSEDVTKQELKNLHKKVSQDIQNHIKLMNDSTHFWWINEHFIQLSIVARSEFKTVMEYVFYQALSDNKITSEEAKFISLCISRLQFAVAVAIPKTDSSVVEYSIEFDGIKHILSGSENAKHVNRIVRAAMDNNNKFEMADLFDNTGSGIVIAARDIKTATRSMVDKEMELSVGKAHISFLYLSDDERSEPKDAFLLLEKINDFGQYEAYKIFVNDEGEIESLNYRKHPNDLEELRIVLFGSMSSKVAKVRYFTKTLEITLKLLGNIIGRVNNKQVAAEAITPSGKSFLALPFGPKSENEESKVEPSKMQKIHDLLKDYFAASDISSDWEVDLTKFSVHDKEYMIHLKDHQDSFRIENKRITLQQEKTNAELAKLKKELNDFKTKFNVDILTKLIAKEEMGEEDRIELEAIEADPYKYAVYRGIVEKMNALYIAIKAISSEMVKNDHNGALGVTGNLLKAVSKDVPLIGTAVGFLADILGAVDAEMQSKMIQKYNKNMPLTGEKMSTLSDLVARKILSFELGDLAESRIDAFTDTVTDAIEKGPATLLVKACLALKEEMEQALGHKKAATEQQEFLGEMHAKIIFKIISEVSFSNKYKNTVKTIKAQFEKIYHHKKYKHEFEFEARAITKKVAKELNIHRKTDHDVDNIHRQSSLSDEEHKAEESVAVARATSNNKEVTQADHLQHGEAEATHKPKGCTPFCTIMAATIESYNNPEFVEEIKKKALTKVQEKKDSKNYFLYKNNGLAFLNKVFELYGKNALMQMNAIGQDEDLVEQILFETSNQGIEKILKIFFEISTEIQTAIDNFKLVIAAEADSHQQAGFLSHIANAYGANSISKASQELIKNINSLFNRIQELLYYGESGNKITLMTSLLESLLGYAESGVNFPIASRPHGGPGDDDGPGGIGGSGLLFEGKKEENEDGSSNIYFVNGSLANITFIMGKVEEVNKLEILDS